MRRAWIVYLLCIPLVLAIGCAQKSTSSAPAPETSATLDKVPVPETPAEKILSGVNKKPVEDSSPLFVVPNGLYLRACPSKDCEVLATLLQGQQVTPLNTSPGWLEVSVEEKGLTGWLGSRHVAKSDAEAPLAAPVPVTEATKPASLDAPLQDGAQPIQDGAQPATPEVQAVSTAAEATTPTAVKAEAETTATTDQPAKTMEAPPPPKEEFSPGTKAPVVKPK